MTRPGVEKGLDESRPSPSLPLDAHPILSSFRCSRSQYHINLQYKVDLRSRRPISSPDLNRPRNPEATYHIAEAEAAESYECGGSMTDVTVPREMPERSTI